MTDQEAFLAICIVSVACDGRIRNDEAAALRKVVENRRLFKAVSEREMSEMTTRISCLITEQGFRPVLDSAMQALSSCYHDAAVAVAAYLIGADRMIQPHEQDFLSYLSTHSAFGGELDPTQIILAFLAFHDDQLRQL